MKNNELYRYRWLVLPILYVVICVWTYFTATLEIDGIALPRSEAGLWGVIALHVMGLLAIIGAYVLHLIVKVWDKFFNH